MSSDEARQLLSRQSFVLGYSMVSSPKAVNAFVWYGCIGSLILITTLAIGALFEGEMSRTQLALLCLVGYLIFGGGLANELWERRIRIEDSLTRFVLTASGIQERHGQAVHQQLSWSEVEKVKQSSNPAGVSIESRRLRKPIFIAGAVEHYPFVLELIFAMTRQFEPASGGNR